MKRLTLISALFVLALTACSGARQTSLEELRSGFEDPPREARTMVWWHWMNGNVTKEGIRKDLEWMDRVGIGGFHHFDVALSTPQTVDKRLVYMDEGWKEAFAYAVRLADSLGLEMTVASAPGWSATGGPWVEPRDAMKKLVWRTLTVEGGSHCSTLLPEPFSTTGAFQNAGVEGRGSASVAEYYEDIAVIAMPLPDEDLSMQEMGARLSSSGGDFVLSELCDDDLANSRLLPSGSDGQAWIMFEFPEARTIRAVSLSDGRGGGRSMGGNSTVWIESSDDGRNFTKVADLGLGGTALRTIGIPATTARYFRIVYKNPTPPGPSLFGPSPAMQAPEGTDISELILHSASMVNRSQDKSAFTAVAALDQWPNLPSDAENFCSPDSIIDISDKVDADGRLDWEVPEGRWKIWRFGYSLTGKQNHPAPPEATGLEVDKLDAEAWTRYFRTYLDMYKEASGGLLGKRGVQYVLNDSYEAEQENWTPAMFEEFLSRRGYDLHPWLPVLAGAVVGSPEQSDAFLRDWRRTIGELITANYELLTKIAVEEYGMLGRYTEAHEGGRVYPVDGMDVKRDAAVPMSAMWTAAPWLGRTPDGDYIRSGYMADCQESSSVANIYGQNIAAAESLTAWGNVQYSYSPQNLKAVADLELFCGINRFVIHESAHQPSDTYVPGYSLGGIGQWFNRHDSWAEQAGVWVGYMSRSCYMLQAGRNVADVLVYYGEDANITALYGSRQPSLPYGYRFDYLGPNALLDCIVAKNGRLSSSRSGTEYKLLWLERNTSTMSVEVLRKLLSLVENGAVLCGSRPLRPFGLQDSREEFDSLVSRIWDSGRANVYENATIAEVLSENRFTPDIMAEHSEGIRYVHRNLGDIDIYWINKPSDKYLDTELSFRITGRKAQIWHPDDGRIEDASYRFENGRTVVSLSLVPDDAVFVVFAGEADPEGFTLPKPERTVLATVEGPWELSFQQGRGAPESAVFDELKSWTESADFGIRYFSGVAEYTTSFHLGDFRGDAGEAGSPERLLLDLGKVGNLAEVYVNGEYCGTAWKEPFTVDVGGALSPGGNELRIRVVNLWVNRLIGDEQPDCPEKITLTDARHYSADTPLLPAGLMGPVQVVLCR